MGQLLERIQYEQEREAGPGRAALRERILARIRQNVAAEAPPATRYAPAQTRVEAAVAGVRVVKRGGEVEITGTMSVAKRRELFRETIGGAGPASSPPPSSSRERRPMATLA